MKIRQNYENRAKISKSSKNLKIEQKFENGSILKILSARHFPNKIFPKKSARHLHMERARGLLPKISGTSARHLQMTRAQNLRVDTRGLPEAIKCTC